MKPSLFMRRPFFVAGYQVTRENMHVVAKWCEGRVVDEDTDMPYIRVHVNRTTNDWQSRAHVGKWVLMSKQRGMKSFKVYNDDWLNEHFFEWNGEIPNAEIDEEDKEGKKEKGTVSSSTPKPKPPKSSHMSSLPAPIPVIGMAPPFYAAT